jgi:transposase
MAAPWGLQHRSLGIDELYWSRRHQYLTLVYQVDAGAKRLLWIGRKRTLKPLLGFFRWFGPKRSQAPKQEIGLGGLQLRSHRELILNWFRARGQISAGAVEGLDGKVRVITKRACGFRTCRAVEVARITTLGAYPSRTSPTVTHRFC